MEGLNAIMPLMAVVHSLIKFAQLCDIFVCDFIKAIKIHEGMYIYHMYCHSHSCFQGVMFTNSHALINFAHKSMIIHYIKNLNT